MKHVIAAALCAAALFATSPAFADGMEGARAQGRSSIILTKEKGVAVYRAQRALLGGEPRAEAEAAPAPASTVTKVVVVHHYHSKIRHLRTQGFYSGHPGQSRRFTQGFYSGPVDKGRR